jgi:hypothetical protein
MQNHEKNWSEMLHEIIVKSGTTEGELLKKLEEKKAE